MHTAWQAVASRPPMASALPTVWESWATRDIRLRRGQLAMLAAAPGVGKSCLALSYSLRARVLTGYVAMDESEHTMAARIMAHQTGVQIPEALREVDERTARARAALDTTSPFLRFFYGPMSEQDVAECVSAIGEGFGRWPDLVVVDNLKNLVITSDDHYAAMGRALAGLSAMAARTNAVVMVLHHVSGAHKDGCAPVPLTGLDGKVAEFPGLILTGYRPELGVTRWCVVKNRWGPADATGRSVTADLNCDLSRSRFSG